MTAVWVLLGIAAALAAIGFMPVGVTAEYSGEGACVWALIGPLRLRLLPRPKKAEKKPAQKPPRKQTGPEAETPKPGGSLPLFRELLGLVLEAQAEIRCRLRIREMVLWLTVGGKGQDPALLGTLYGGGWAALGNLLPLLERSFRIQSRDIRTGVDFLSEETKIYAKATAVLSVGAALRMAGYYGVRGLKLYQRHQKKGGNKHGTSDQ